MSEREAGQPIAPARFQPPTSRKLGRLLYALVFSVPGAFLVAAPLLWNESVGALVALVIIGLMFLVVAVYLLQEGLQTVVVSAKGVELTAPLRSRLVDWKAVGRVVVGTIAHSERRRMAVSGSLGAVGTAIANAMEAPATDKAALFERPCGERADHTPYALLRSPDGRRLLRFSTVLDWPFYDALIAAAAANGIELEVQP